MQVQLLLRAILVVLGFGFLVVNARVCFEYLRFLRRRPTALVTWAGPRAPYAGLGLAISVTLGVLILYKLYFLLQPLRQVFGESMMFLYYAYAQPLSRRIGRGFYADGVWTDTEFLPYGHISGISWRETEHEVVLIIIARAGNLAWRLTVPGHQYAAARRILRDKIRAHDIHFTSTGLDLGAHDEIDAV